MAKQNGKSKVKTEEPKAAYFLSLTLSNVRCFGPEQTLDLSDGNGKPARWTVLLGENGTGKTTLLQMLLNFGVMSQSARRKRVYHFGIGGPPESPRLTVPDPDAERFLRLGRNAIINKLVAISEQLTSTPIKEVLEKCTVHSDRLEFENLNSFESRDFFAYGANRRFGTAPFEEGESDLTASLFNDQTSLRNPEEWLLRIDYAAAKKLGKQEFQLSSLTRILIAILPDIEDIRFIPGDGPYPKPRVDFKTPYGWVPMRQLGYGYQSMITWVVDLATRLFERYPESENPLAEPAVVLVDEIDLHLHPVWQRKLMADLTKNFPNTQFIVTAHSPLIVQAVEDANIAVLKREGDHVEIINDLDHIRNWRIDQILTSDLFGLETARPPYIEDLLRKRKEILSKSELTKADKKKLKELEDRIGTLPIGESTQEMEERKAIWEAIDFLKGRKHSHDPV